MRCHILSILVLGGLVNLAAGQVQTLPPLGPQPKVAPRPAPADPAAAAVPFGTEAKSDETTKQIERLIRELGDEQFAVREAAAAELAKLGSKARQALTIATRSDDAEIASRARLLLDRLPTLTHVLLDAVGQPIPEATVTVRFTPGEAAGATSPPALPPIPAKGDVPLPPGLGGQPEQITLQQVTETDGRFGIPDGAKNVSVIAQHKDYGQAQCELDTHSGKLVVQMPLVRSGTEAFTRRSPDRL